MSVFTAQTNEFIYKVNRNHINDSTLCDFEIKSKTRLFKVHKCLVIAASNFFKKLLVTNPKQKCQDQVIIDVFDDIIMELVIEYIYGKEVTITKENVLDVFKASGYFKLTELKNSCMQSIKNNLTPKNVLSVWMIAKQYFTKELEAACQVCISNNFEHILSQSDFLRISSSYIIEFLNMKSTGLSEISFYRRVVKWVKFDITNRKQFLSEIFGLIDLTKIEKCFIKSEVANNCLVLNNVDCLKVIVKTLISEIGDVAKAPHFSQFTYEELGLSPSLIMIGGEMKPLSARKYNIATSSWQKFPDMVGECVYFGLVSVRFVLYAIGGREVDSFDSYPDVHALQLYETSPKWIEKSDMIEKRYKFGCTTVGGQIFVAGGKANRREWLSSVECYTIKKNRWQKRRSMSNKRAGCCLVNISGLLYALGGSCDNFIHSSVEVFWKNRWKAGRPMLKRRTDFAAVVFNNEIYAIGGKTGFCCYSDSVEKYNGLVWRFVANLRIPRSGHSACIYQKKIYVIGGVNWKGSVNLMEVYDPETNVWKTSYMNKDLISAGMVSLIA